MIKAKAPLAECDKCPLKNKPFVPPQKRVGADFAVVGESPDPKQIKTGSAFSGLGPNLLGTVLEEQGFDKDKIHVTNAVLCVNFDDKEPPVEAVACCNARLLAELKEAGVKRVLTAGAVASDAVCLEPIDKITAQRGQIRKGKGNFDVKVGLRLSYVLFKNSAINDFRLDIQTVLKDRHPRGTVYTIISSPAQLQSLIKRGTFRGATVGYDLETTSLEPHKAKILCVNLSVRGGFSYIVVGDALFDLHYLFASDDPATFVAWNAKYDNKVLLANGITPPANYDDAMLMQYTTREAGGHGLKKNACDELEITDWEAELKAMLPKKKG